MDAKKRKRSRLMVVLLLLLFTGPWVLAQIFYENQDWLSTHTTNKGHLITPPINASTLAIINSRGNTFQFARKENKKWTLLLFYPGKCDKTCMKKSYYLRQITIATGKNQNRVERGILTYEQSNKTNTFMQRKFPSTRNLIVNQTIFKNHIHKAIKQSFALSPGAIYLVDPIGNLMMVYPPSTKPKSILKDLRHLLKLSGVG